ncbi:CP2 transcription factor-domain-containing protein [Amylocarpus encephaloides]|uniref:CP2 transcription factor-domain-containing protein n=1 Tax=Amylocarpus encephaloides TaxID=45428 RepID=A0A9P7YCZ0_9HELO|nr:CP2 transcription factor-domain-containing protein [Amylocarpus encephaloides]
MRGVVREQHRASATSSQKPGDAFIATFRQNFPEIAATTADTSGGSTSVDAVAGDPQQKQSQDASHQDIKDLDPTPRAQNDQWRFTPSLLDPNSFAFSNFANQLPGYYTPTLGGTSTLYHNQAGDLHTPGMGLGMGLGTPLSMPTSSDDVHASVTMDMPGFGQHMPPQFDGYNPFSNPRQHHHQPPHPLQNLHHQQEQTQPPVQTSFAPSSFIHQDTGYETMEHDGSPADDERRMASMEASIQNHSPVMNFHPTDYDMAVNAPMPAPAEKFRFHVTLNAPTAMIKHSDEIPITYLNKGQAYSISIIDTTPTMPIPVGTRYRTFVRISFEDVQQRQRPATCWQLWKEGRGANEAHHRGGKLQAVEYVEASQPAETNDKRTRVDLDSASFDGFSVIWTPSMNGSSECNIAVRFNFLSTDFSHSKGVKGIPVRLCAKTETVPNGSPHSAPEFSEVTFCKVKLFRDHGAERKLSNDVAHVKKTIDKLQQQITQAETGMKDFGKRKRSGSIPSKAQSNQRPGKVQKHKRTWSMSSASSTGGRMPLEEDLHYKLRTMQDMFTSTRPVSILYLRGEEQDDPDRHPVALAGEPLDLTKVDSLGASAWQQRSDRGSTTGTSSLMSPSPSSISLHSQGRSGVNAPNTTGPCPEFQSAPADITSSNPQQLASPPDQLTKVPKTDDSGSLTGWIEALGVDPSYQPPVVEHSIKPVACFYILNRNSTQTEENEYYRAIYLTQRTLQNFKIAISTKWNVEPTKIFRILHVLDCGLEVEMDDDVIRELAEGQDLTMEITHAKNQLPVKREWEMCLDVKVDSDQVAGTQTVVHTDGFVIRLMF